MVLLPALQDGFDELGPANATDQDVATLINVFTVTRETQQPLVELLIKSTEQVMRHRPGFVSANIHASLDGMS